MSNRTVVVGIAVVFSFDDNQEGVAVVAPPHDRVQERRPLLHHYYRRRGFGFVPHATPTPKKIVRSNL